MKGYHSVKQLCPYFLSRGVRFLRSRSEDNSFLSRATLVLKLNRTQHSTMSLSISMSRSDKNSSISVRYTTFPFVSDAIKCLSTTSVMTGRLKPEEVRRRIEDITDRFAEAREFLGDARESLGSTYFSDDMMDAQEAVNSTLTMYKGLLAELDEDQRNEVIRTVGLRMEELKAQEQAIKDLLD